jgi:sugar (pentulose or hexulose) kinase
VAQRVAPEASRAARMKRQYAVYRQLYPALRGIFHELQNA